jgi:hypothetical protein
VRSRIGWRCRPRPVAGPVRCVAPGTCAHRLAGGRDRRWPPPGAGRSGGRRPGGAARTARVTAPGDRRCANGLLFGPVTRPTGDRHPVFDPSCLLLRTVRARSL